MALYNISGLWTALFGVVVACFIPQNRVESFVLSRGPTFSRSLSSYVGYFPVVLRSTQEQEGTEREQVGSHERDRSQKGETPPRKKEYWLDLRKTAILPDEALQFLEQNLFQSKDSPANGKNIPLEQSNIVSLVDRVLLSEEMFLKALSHKSSTGIKVLYTLDGDSALIASDDEREQSYQVGKVISCEYNESIDPLSALETTGDGGWLLVEGEVSTDQDAVNWLQNQISSLVTFLLSAFPSSDSSLPSGLLLPTISTGSPQMGGVAIACGNKQALVQTDVALEQSMGTTMITTCTETGLILPTGIPERPGEEARLRTALALPFDVMMWETVLELQGVEGL